METALYTDDLQGIQETLRGLLEGLPLELQCSSQEGALMILGQHPADLDLEPQDIFRRLERQIQILPLRFVQQARLYLRVTGESQPYAHRFFLIQPPPPPPPPPPPLPSSPVMQPLGADAEEPWELSDEELDSWLNELVGTDDAEREMVGLSSLGELPDPFAPLEPDAPLEFVAGDPVGESDLETTEATLSLIPWEDLDDRLAEQVWEAPDLPEVPTRSPLNSRLMMTGGAIAMGMVGGVYGLSRPCVVGTCPELQTVQQWNQEAIQQAQEATDANEIAAAQDSLQRAIATLEMIPAWSWQGGAARNLQHRYAQQEQILELLTQMTELAQTASDRRQNGPHNVETWQEIVALWEEAIDRLDTIPADSPFFRPAQRLKQQYEESLALDRRSLAAEEAAQEVLKMAQQGIQMAEARQQIAQSPEQWQLVRITWQVVVNRLREVPAGTYAAVDAQRLLQSYQPRLMAAATHLEQEQQAATLLQQATAAAQSAQQAAQQFNWEGAIAAWTHAIHYTEQIPPSSAEAAQSQELAHQYNTALEQAKQQQEASLTISLDVDRACNQELRKCRLMVVSNAIRIQLTPNYMRAITTARESGNRDLQAVVAEHQLALRRTLETLAARFQRPVEVYDDHNGLLDRHLPQPTGG